MSSSVSGGFGSRSPERYRLPNPTAVRCAERLASPPSTRERARLQTETGTGAVPARDWIRCTKARRCARHGAGMSPFAPRKGLQKPFAERKATMGEKHMTTFAVLGSGGWGTAVAVLLAQNPAHRVRLRSAHADNAAKLRESRENSRLLPGARFPDSLEITA